MTDQMRSLSIRQVMDSSGYVAGAREFVAANKEMSNSSAVIGAVITQTQVKISNAADPVSRLTRAYDQTTASQLKFQAELTTLNRQLETNKISAEAASRIYAGLVKVLGMSADGADITAQGFARMGAVISTTNKEMLEFGQVSRAIALASAEMEQMTQRGAALRAQLDPIGTSQARLNTELAEYNALLKAGQLNLEQFGSLENQARVRHEQFAASLNKTPGAANDNSGGFRRQNLGYQAFDVGQGLTSGMPIGLILAQQGPQIAQLYASAGGAKALAEDAKAVMSGVATAARAAFAFIGPIGLAFAAASLAAGAFYLFTRESTKTTDEVLKEHATNIKALGDAYGIAEEKAKSYSDADRAVAEAAARRSNLEVVEKQRQAIQDLSDQFGQIGVGGKGGAPTFQMKGGYREFQDAFNQLRKDGEAQKFIDDVKRIGEETGFQKQADRILEATRSLKDLSTEADKAGRIMSAINGASQRGFVASDQQARKDFEDGLTAAYLRQQAVLDKLRDTKAAFDAQVLSVNAKSPQEKAAAARAGAAATVDPSENADVRAQRIELAGKQALVAAEHDLTQAKEERVRASQSSLEAAQNELSLIGKTVAEQNRFRAEYEATAQIKEAAARAGVKANDDEIAAARAKAAQFAQINQQVAASKLLQGQQDEIQQLQLEAQLIGATAQQRARSTAALQAEQQMRQQGIDILSREGQQYKANAITMAEARLEIERQNAAYQSLQQAEGSAIDAMVTGTGTLKERLKSAADAALQWFEQIAVANPLKNMLTGTNLPTLGDLFSGKPLVGAGATNTASMTVTAGTVMVNGGVSGLPGFPTSGIPGSTTTLGGFLGLGSPANQNGVRPDAIAGTLFNSPLTSAASTTSLTGVQGQVWNYWASKGLQPHQIAGIMGNMQAESAFNPGAVGDNGNALGLAQWNDRGPAMQAAVPDWRTNLNGQLDFMSKEFATTENGSWNKLMASTDVRSATAAVAGYERPRGYTAANPEGADNWSGRLNAANQNLTKFSSTAASASKDVSVLGDSTTKVASTLTDTLGSNGALSKAVVPQAAAPAANYFPPAPSGGGFNIGSLFSSFFSLFGFADGTDFSPGGMAWVGERGRELVHLPRGSAVTPNHKLNALGGGSQSVNMRHEYNITVGGNGDKELLERMHAAAEESIRVSMDAYDKNVLFKRISDYQQDPYARGS
jgi:hypothetical protein